MKEIHFRSAVLNDLPILLDFEQGIIRAERPYDHTLRPDPINYYDIKALIEAEDSEVIVAAVDKEIIGSAYISIKKAKPYRTYVYYGYLGFMYVKPEYRGMGVNKGIIEALKNWARSRNITELQLEVYNDNHPAVKAYEKAGFEKHLVNMRLEL